MPTSSSPPLEIAHSLDSTPPIDVDSQQTSHAGRRTTQHSRYSLMQRRYIVIGAVSVCTLVFLVVRSGVLDLPAPEDVVRKDVSMSSRDTAYVRSNSPLSVDAQTVVPAPITAPSSSSSSSTTVAAPAPTVTPLTSSDTNTAATAESSSTSRIPPTEASETKPKPTKSPTIAVSRTPVIASPAKHPPTSTPIPSPVSSAQTSTQQNPTLKDIVLTNPLPAAQHYPARKDNSDFTDTERRFLSLYCDFIPNDPTDDSFGWYPTAEESAWKQLVPNVIIAGTQQSASTSIYNTLLQHPDVLDIANAKDVGFFSPDRFAPYLSRIPPVSDPSATPVRKRHVYQARTHMYGNSYKTSLLKKRLSADTERGISTTVVTMDGTSSYFTYSDQVPYNILCTAPWAKIIIILRNPIDRVYAQWSFERQKYKLALSFDEWIAVEWKIMQEAGLLSSHEKGSDNDKNNDDEFEAWKRYIGAIRVSPYKKEPAIGVSMYAIPLEHWITAYTAAGKDVSQVFHVVPMEVLDSASQATALQNLVQFLGLSSVAELPYIRSNPSLDQGPISNETRVLLSNFFAAYNKRLFRLLKKHSLTGAIGYSNWKKVWS